MDKSFVLRFNRTPRNYSEEIIQMVYKLLKLTFFFHLVAGLMLLSNNAILASNSVENQNQTIVNANEWAI